MARKMAHRTRRRPQGSAASLLRMVPEMNSRRGLQAIDPHPVYLLQHHFHHKCLPLHQPRPLLSTTTVYLGHSQNNTLHSPDCGNIRYRTTFSGSSLVLDTAEVRWKEENDQ